jgi:glucan biosynthesis protein C
MLLTTGGGVTGAPLTTPRIHAVDCLRTLAMIALFFAHVAHIFDFDLEASIKNPETSLAASVFMFFVVQWVNALLFLLAGTSQWFSLHSRSRRAYLRERVNRLLIPLLFGSAVLIPWIGYMSALNHASFEGSFWAYVPVHFERTWASLQIPALHHGPIALYYTSWHLWFLGYLLIFSALSLCLLRGHARTSWLAALCERRVGLLVLGVPIVVVKIGLGAAFPAYLDWSDTLVFFACFIYGWLFMTDGRFFRAVERDALWWVTVGCAAFALLLGSHVLGYLPRWLAQPGYTPDYLFYQGLLAVNAWAWVLGLVGCGLRWLNVEHAALEYAHGAVLPFYVLHQVAVATVGTIVVGWSVGIAMKFIVISGVAFTATILTYEVVVRRSRPLRVLFGLKPAVSARRSRSAPARAVREGEWHAQTPPSVPRVSSGGS